MNALFFKYLNGRHYWISNLVLWISENYKINDTSGSHVFKTMQQKPTWKELKEALLTKKFYVWVFIFHCCDIR